MLNEQTKPRNWIITIASGAVPTFPQLLAADFDASDIHSILTRNWRTNFDESVLITSEFATTKNVNTALNEILVRRSQEGDSVFVYLSGHVDPDVRGITGSFVTLDYEKAGKNFGLNLRSLRYLVEDSRARYVVVVIDACHAGVVAQAERTQVPHWLYFTTGEMEKVSTTRLFLTAVTSGQKAFACPGQRNSDFTQIIIEILTNAIENRKTLSTSSFVDQLFLKTRDFQNSTPVLSGIMAGYSELLRNESPQRIDFDTDEIQGNGKIDPVIPGWLNEAVASVNEPDPDDRCDFVADVNYPDGATLSIGQEIVKCWRIRNAGCIPWRNRFLMMVASSRGAGRIHGSKMIPLISADPGDELDVIVSLRMPPYPASVYAEFKMTDAAGNILFPNKKGLYISVNVVDLAHED